MKSNLSSWLRQLYFLGLQILSKRSRIRWNKTICRRPPNSWKRHVGDVGHFTRSHTIKAGKILSFHAKELACINKGKLGKDKEFGRVFQLGRVGGNFRIVLKSTSVIMKKFRKKYFKESSVKRLFKKSAPNSSTLILALIGITTIATPLSLNAAEIVHCSSVNDASTPCAGPNVVRAWVAKKSPDSTICKYKKDSFDAHWNIRSSGVLWVHRGCEADFYVEYGEDFSDRCSGNQNCVPCDSNYSEYNECSGSILNLKIAPLFSTECVLDKTYGITSEGRIWVRSGCKADFIIQTKGGLFIPPPYGPVVSSEDSNGNDVITTPTEK